MLAADRTLQLIADTLTATEAPAMTGPDADRIPLRTAELSTAGQLAQAQGRIRALEALRDRLTATVAGADTERDQARTDLGQALGQLTDARAALNAAGYAHPAATVADLIAQCAADRDSATSQLSQARSAAHKLEVERDDLRIQLGRADADNRAMMRDRNEVIAERDKARQERDTLAARLEHAETARIDVDGDLWRPAPDAQWTLSGDRTVRLDEDVLEHLHGPTRPVLIIDNGPQDDDEPAPAPSPGSGPTRAQGAIEGLLANVGRSLASAIDDDERAEAIGMLLDGWYAAWPDSAVTDPHEPLAGELVRLLGTPAVRPADWEQRAVDAAREALGEAWHWLANDPAAARRLATIAVRAIIDAGLVGPGGRCPRCGSTYPRTLPPGEDGRCWTCATEDQTGGLDEPAATPTLGEYHWGRAWGPTQDEATCPCPKAPCGYVVRTSEATGCELHGPSETMRGGHFAASCPANTREG
ncbi:hypothetical protein ACFUYE_00535 [Micromonospora humida]|uniref:hypothetical protein n=1 Tax=Micromonospora humida TaxID=2809018 RepID=UPI0036725B3D